MATAKLALKNGSYNTLIGVNGEPASDISFNIPSTLGSSNQVLTTDGAGNLTWALPVDAITGTYSFTSGITDTIGTVKLGGALTTNTDTSLTLPGILEADSNSDTSLSITDGYQTTFIVNNSKDDDNVRNSIISNSTGVYGTYSSVTQLNANNIIKSESNRYTSEDIGGPVSIFGYDNFITLDSNVIAANNTKRARIKYTMGSTGEGNMTTGGVGTPEYNMLVLDTTTDTSYLNFIVNPSKFELNRTYSTTVANLLSYSKTTLSYSTSVSTAYDNIGRLLQTYNFNSSKTGLGAIGIDLSAYGILYTGGHSAASNSATIYLKGLDAEDNLIRTVASTLYPRIHVQPIKYVLDATVGGIAYDKTVFKADLTVNGDNYVLDTYPILNTARTTYGNVTANNLFTIKNNGNYRFSVAYDGKIGINITEGGSGTGYYLPIAAPSYSGTFMTYDAYGVTAWNNNLRMIGTTLNVKGDIIANGTASMSDIRLKKYVNTIGSEYALDILNQLNPVTFSYIEGDTTEHMGLIAQEVEKLLPNIVDEIEDMKYIRYSELIGLLIGAIQELNKKICR